MPKNFRVIVSSPDGLVQEASVVSMTVPLADGSAGILADHAPLIGLLKPGELLLRKPSGAEERITVVASGFFQVDHNNVTVLLDKNP
jgi:F-type H+-transporting ATPase subunit epsilon